MESQIDTGAATTTKGRILIEEPTRAERVIGRRAAESRATVPDFELTTTVDMSAVVAGRTKLRAALEPEAVPSLTAVIVRACGLALGQDPRANGAYKDGHFELHARVNIGVAIATEDGLAVPTILDADAKSTDEISVELRSLTARVRAGAITPPDLAGPTFTVFNLGMYGVTSFSPPVVAPQAAILAVGAAREVPIVRDGDIVTGYEMNLTLSCDHRILYGAHAAEFLARIRAWLEQPKELLS